MSAQHPTPWRAEGQGIHDRLRHEYWAVLDRRGIFVMDALDETTACEIVDAVNRRTALAAAEPSTRLWLAEQPCDECRDRLAILVGRLADNLERFHIVGERDRDLLREARAALKRKGKRP